MVTREHGCTSPEAEPVVLRHNAETDAWTLEYPQVRHPDSTICEVTHCPWCGASLTRDFLHWESVDQVLRDLEYAVKAGNRKLAVQRCGELVSRLPSDDGDPRRVRAFELMKFMQLLDETP